jgi:putative alpha-1,2-mannosidase
MLKSLCAFSTLLIICSLANAQFVDKVSDPVDYVNPLMGTQSLGDLSNGNTYPSIALPWGMNFWTPQTGKMASDDPYSFSTDKSNPLNAK